MKHRQDLKAELVELQIAAQHWETKYLEAKRLPVCNGRCSALSAQVEELRASLGEASRELMACKEQLSKYEGSPKYESDQDEALSQYCNQPHDFE